MITRYLSLILLLIVLLAAPSTLIAQTTSQPIIMVSAGDLWVWDNGLTRLTQDENIIGAVMSPDGTHIACNVVSPVSLDAIERVGGWNGYRPDDIHVIGVDGSQRVAGVQPPDAVLFADDGRPDNAWVRSLPTWSPDGTQVAWTEYNIGQTDRDDTSGHLVIYDLATDSTRIVVSNLPIMLGAGPPPINVWWGSSSLMLWMWSYQAADGSGGSAFWFYDANGTLLEDRPITPEQDRGLDDIRVVSDGQTRWFGLFYSSGEHHLIAPNVAIIESYPITPALISGHTLPNSVALTYKINSNADYRERMIWTATYPDGDSYTLSYRGDQIAISPDGASVAYIEDDTLTIWSRGTATTEYTGLERIGPIMWGATQWRDGEPTYDCAVMPRTHLTVGEQARVIPDTSPNNLRATYPSGEVVAQLPPGDEFTVLAGPVCMAGHHWWQVDYQGTIGWTAEVGGGERWIEPLP